MCDAVLDSGTDRVCPNSVIMYPIHLKKIYNQHANAWISISTIWNTNKAERQINAYIYLLREPWHANVESENRKRQNEFSFNKIEWSIINKTYMQLHEIESKWMSIAAKKKKSICEFNVIKYSGRQTDETISGWDCVNNTIFFLLNWKNH